MLTEHLTRLSPENIKDLRGASKDILKYALNQGLEAYRVFPDKRILILKKGDEQVWLDTSLTSKTNPVGMRIARNKQLTKKFLRQLGYPVAPSRTVSNIDEISQVVEEIPFPLVAKPLGAAEGKGITVNINDKRLLADSFHSALKFDKKVIIEKHIPGDYYRITYVADGAYAVMKNLPACVTGNGKNTIKELIDIENATNTERRPGGKLKRIRISGKTERFVASAGYQLESVLPEGKNIPLCFSGFDGGEYVDATKEVHPYFLEMSREISESLGLPIVGIDIISRDISVAPNENGGVVIEINGTYPDILFHSHPTRGEAVQLVPNLIDYLFS